VNGVLAAGNMPAFTGGDASSSAGSVALTLATVNGSGGTGTKITSNGKGLVTSFSSLTLSDLPSTYNALTNIITNGIAATPGMVVTLKSDGTLTLSNAASSTTTAFTNGAHIDIPLGFWASTPAATAASASNIVSVWSFEVANPVVLNYFLFRGDTASATGHWGVSVYTSDGLTKVYDSGALTTAASSFSGVVVAVTNGFPITLQRGWYYLAWNLDNTTATVRQNSGSAGWGSIWNSFPGTTNSASASVQVGTAKNLASGGVNPSTLGGITNNTSTAFNVLTISLKN
jgi:hypothetical protein